MLSVELYAEEFCVYFVGMENYDVPKSPSSSNYDIPRSSAGEGAYDVPRSYENLTKADDRSFENLTKADDRSYENLTKADDEFQKIQDVPGDVSL